MGCLAEMTVAASNVGLLRRMGGVLCRAPGRVPGSLCLLVVHCLCSGHGSDRDCRLHALLVPGCARLGLDRRILLDSDRRERIQRESVWRGGVCILHPEGNGHHGVHPAGRMVAVGAPASPTTPRTEDSFPRVRGVCGWPWSVSIFSYLSIEMIAVAAGEAEDPQTGHHQSFSLHGRAPGALLSADHGDHPGAWFPGRSRERAKAHL